jgi:ADP-ribose pyrophosphatase YjhB (NUDIX family)
LRSIRAEVRFLTIPLSVKGVVVVEGRVLLLRNERDEWDLPGGRPDAGETYEAAVAREAREEANVEVAALDCLDDWPYEVLPGRFVRILAYGCRVIDASRTALSHEHRELRFFAREELDGLRLHEGYRRVIDRWFARATR